MATPLVSLSLWETQMLGALRPARDRKHYTTLFSKRVGTRKRCRVVRISVTFWAFLISFGDISHLFSVPTYSSGCFLLCWMLPPVCHLPLPALFLPPCKRVRSYSLALYLSILHGLSQMSLLPVQSKKPPSLSPSLTIQIPFCLTEDLKWNLASPNWFSGVFFGQRIDVRWYDLLHPCQL